MTDDTTTELIHRIDLTDTRDGAATHYPAAMVVVRYEIDWKRASEGIYIKQQAWR